MQSSPRLLNSLLRLGHSSTPPSSPRIQNRTDRTSHRTVNTRLSPSTSVAQSPVGSPRTVRHFCSTAHVPNHSDIKELVDDKPITQSEATVSPSQWVWQGSKRTFISKTPEQYWKDLQDNRKELAWSQTERVHSKIFPTEHDLNATQWYDEWKANSPGKANKQRPISSLNIDYAARSNQTYSPNQVQIMVTPPSESNETSTKTASSSHLNSSNHRAYFDSIGNELGVKSLDDWYSISITDVKRFDSSYEVLACYGNSLIQGLMSVYPEHPWKIWQFENSYKGLFDDEPDQQAMKKSNASPTDARSEDPNTTLGRYSSHWQVRLFSPSKNDSWAAQSAPYIRMHENAKISDDFEETFDIPRKADELTNLVHELFPEMKPHIEYSSPELVYSDTKRPFTLDIYLPEIKLAFEYIEDPNYSWQYTFGANFSIYTFHKAKRAVCEKLGITLIEVPSWWNRELSSLVQAIKRSRPELLQGPSPRTSPELAPKKAHRPNSVSLKSKTA